jgi:glycosyltransferase involved in cell wall biosynthesis
VTGTRLRILVVPKWYPWHDRPVFGAFVREHARALARRHEVVVLASRATPTPGFAVFQLDEAVEDGLLVLRVRYRRPRFRAAAMACQTAGMLAGLLRLRRRGFWPDVVHAHVYSAALPALLLGRLAGARMAVTEHYTGFGRGLVTGADRWVARAAFSRADVVAPVSEDLAGHLRALAPRARIRVLPNVVDTEVFGATPREPHEGPARLLTVGALADRKGHAYLLDALAILRRRREAELDVVGDGELRIGLEARAAELDLGSAVRFLGELPKHGVARLMARADLFVLPSLYETFGCVLIEAMASGLPVVATRVGGVPEVLPPVAGELVAPRDPAAMARAIEVGLDRVFDAAELRALAERRYGYAVFGERWTAVYRELLSRRGRTSFATSRRSASSR